ncbi:hypothetical protein MOO45_07145 [Bombilactobacillus folatiphilus]|uniref:WxL domain-containing protein n=1 Tax=Bombilactobacillus folatiphilus TaxID=2923362 RepID=A0ABY4P8N5_9LACO|nr:hypothetical protein [Bombilactobacillus folatiphilus]UQS81956.1 hypothetical protein MOO45_07145 [Bombilactobacillus folatiphilus]
MQGVTRFKINLSPALSLIALIILCIVYLPTVKADILGSDDPSAILDDDEILPALPDNFQSIDQLAAAHPVSDAGVTVSDQDYTFRPHFSAEPTIDSFVYDANTKGEITTDFNDPHMKGHRYLKLSAENNATDLGVTVIYKNVGTYNGKNLDMQVHSTFHLPGTSSERYGAVGINKDDFLNLHLRSRGSGWAAHNQITFYEAGTKNRVTVKGYWNFTGINKAKLLTVTPDLTPNNDTIYYQYQGAASNEIGFKQTGDTYQFLSTDKAGNMDTQFTMRFASDTNEAFEYGFDDPSIGSKNATVGINYTDQNIFSYTPTNPKKAGKNATEFNAPYNALFTVQQDIAPLEKVGRPYSTFTITDKINANLDIDHQNTRVVDQNDHTVSGADRLFQLNFGADNTITATVNTAALKQTNETAANYFYNNKYVLKIYGRLKTDTDVTSLTPSTINPTQVTDPDFDPNANYYNISNQATTSVNGTELKSPIANANVLSPKNWWYTKDNQLYIRNSAIGQYTGTAPWTTQANNITNVHFGTKVTLNNTQDFLKNMFNLTNVTLPADLDTHSSTDFSGFFMNDDHLTTIIGLGNLQFNNAQNLANMFQNTGLSQLTLPTNFAMTRNVTNFDNFSSHNANLTKLDLSQLQMNANASTHNFFAETNQLNKLKLGPNNHFEPNDQTSLTALTSGTVSDNNAWSGTTGKWQNDLNSNTHTSEQLINSYQNNNPNHPQSVIEYTPQVANLVYFKEIPDNLTFGPIILDSSDQVQDYKPNAPNKQIVEVEDLRNSELQGKNWQVSVKADSFTYQSDTGQNEATDQISLALNQNIITNQAYPLEHSKQTVNGDSYQWKLDRQNQTGLTVKINPSADLISQDYQSNITYTLANSL